MRHQYYRIIVLPINLGRITYHHKSNSDSHLSEVGFDSSFFLLKMVNNRFFFVKKMVISRSMKVL